MDEKIGKAGRPGLEPRQTGSKPVVLPITPSASVPR